jgi:hypothetical protein
MQVRGDGVRIIAFLESLHRCAPNKAPAAVPYIENDAAFLGGEDSRVYAAID